MTVTQWSTRRARVPTYGRAVIHRRRLHDALSAVAAPDPDAPGTVAMLSAPVGSGKTMLLADWVTETAATQDVPTIAWLTVQESDNERGTLAPVLTALRATDDPDVLSALSKFPADAATEDPSVVAEALSAVDKPIVMVLDDVHLLRDPDTLEALGSFLRWAPPALRTVLAGRFEPPLALHRMRLDGRVRDFPPQELAFTEDEATQLFAGHQLALDDSDLHTVWERTQGWAVGLRLAAIVLGRATDPAAILADFGGDHRVVADYLVGEVLDHLEPSERAFVVESSIPDSFTVELAEELTGNSNAGAILDALERENFPLERISGRPGWYRYRPLLREYLQAEVSRLGRKAVTDLENVAARWFARSGADVRALEHAQHAGDDRALRSLIAGLGLGSVLRGHGDRVIDVLDHAPPSVRAGRSARLVRAAAELARGNDAAAASVLGTDDAGTSTGTSNTQLLEHTLRLQLALRTGGLESALTRLRDDAAGRSGNPELDSFTLLTAGSAELRLGQLDDATRELEAAAATARSADLPALRVQAHASLAAVAACRCALTAADRQAATAIELGVAGVVGSDTDVRLAVLIRDWVRYVRMDPPAPASVDHHPAPADHAEPAIASIAAFVEGLVDRTDAATPRQHAGALLDLLESATRHPVPPGIVALLAPAVQRALLDEGQDARVGQLSLLLDRMLGRTGETALVTATVALRRGRLDLASTELAPVLDGTLRCVAPLTSIHAWLLAATIADRRDDDIHARSGLAEALALAEPERITRPFFDGGARIRSLLDRHTGRFGVQDEFAEHVRLAIPVTAPDRSPPLTARERELLTELPSWRTAEQIAADLFVSVNTVKTHLRGIYRKLGVRTRQEAIAEARKQGLL
ncbi:Transcriptional regulator [Rhodococcus sp. RD6.2]|jgi:ATP/maltotriose-dependent transcriptional regulator MalT|uniref:LuxR C-terminal-related transcriptional regulator n=1 Tax=Rhodococcus sp. RD6.2 TaxID=260936 RepID=UPI00063B1E12|nr:LuxR C-terminal-related transcriptional regulator [Rhodococcus sp. RD6.2]CRK54508.1 Transcriptional regulator [Rhodococcus sp. RD6.2]